MRKYVNANSHIFVNFNKYMYIFCFNKKEKTDKAQIKKRSALLFFIYAIKRSLQQHAAPAYQESARTRQPQTSGHNQPIPAR